ncbi:MAG TPA: restriction endonuclease [Gaiellaceae bacterium]|nr:restriction endonuclease [Gaiellaceae bacterium]
MLAPDPRLERIDQMDGLEFEESVKELLELLGFTDVELTPRFDKGADLIAVRDGVRTAVQVKRRSSSVRKDAVLQLRDGMEQYDCAAGLLVTNSFLTSEAQQRARYYGIEVWDRRRIAEHAEGEQPDLDTKHCAHCGDRVPAGVEKFCLDRPGRFGGLVYCMAHQARKNRRS